MVNFVLSSLDSSVAMGLAGNLFSSIPPAIDASATAIIYVNIDDMKSVFQFQPNSADMTNLGEADIKYYIDTASWPAINPANAMLSVSALSQGAIALVDSSGLLADYKQMVAHDFNRYLAQCLFGTHLGVDLFNNETELLQNSRLICDDSATGHTWYDVVEKVTSVSKFGSHLGLVGDAGSQYMTDATDDSTNLCRVLFTQMIGADAGRFSAIVNEDLPQPLPFAVDDAISFKLTIAPAEGQEALTQLASPIGPRSYEIRLVIKDAVDVVNTAVSADEV